MVQKFTPPAPWKSIGERVKDQFGTMYYCTGASSLVLADAAKLAFTDEKGEVTEIDLSSLEEHSDVCCYGCGAPPSRSMTCSYCGRKR